MKTETAKKIAKTKRPFAVIFEYATGSYGKGEVLSTHKSYDLAIKAQKKSGYQTFTVVRDSREYA